MPVGLNIVLIGTTTIMHSAVLTIYNNDRFCGCIYATNMTQTPHVTKNKSKNIKNVRLNMLLRFQLWMPNLEWLLAQQVARWCVKVLMVKGNQKSGVVEEASNSIPNVVASDNVLCGHLSPRYNDSYCPQFTQIRWYWFCVSGKPSPISSFSF